MITEDIGVYKSCSYVELGLLYLISLLILLFAVLSIPIIPAGIGIIASSILAFFLLAILAGWFQDKKRNLPQRFYLKKIAIVLNKLFDIKIYDSKYYGFRSRYSNYDL